ncbi:MAG: antitoxin [Spirochaetes bacterium]|nr:MAG: antitoxin [Spirochaetota bacterium]RKX95202.1 MAG: antitoxin [Spirochaetota bacterium]
MKTLTIRGLDTELDLKIKERAAQSGESINRIVLQLLKSSLGIGKNKAFPTYYDLDKLAGTWTENDELEFTANIEELGKVDKELWK